MLFQVNAKLDDRNGVMTHQIFGYVRAESKAHAVWYVISRLLTKKDVLQLVMYGFKHDEAAAKDTLQKPPCILLALTRAGTTLRQWLNAHVEEEAATITPSLNVRLSYYSPLGLYYI